MVFILAWVLVKNLVGAFQCTPVKKAWLKKTPGHCINFIDLVIYAQACNIIFDIAILILPIREIYKLQLRPLKKVGVMAIFTVGSLYVSSRERVDLNVAHVSQLYHIGPRQNRRHCHRSQ